MKKNPGLFLSFFLVVVSASLWMPGCDKLITEVNNNTYIDTSLGRECYKCHTDKDDKLIVVPKGQWENSAHSSPHLLELPINYNGQIKVATACGPTCHSGNGYVDTVTLGRISDTTRPSVVNCFTCHLPHSVQNATSLLDSLRGTPLAVTLADGESKYIHGKSNMCAICHRATGAPPKPPTGDITLSANFGPHYSAQADVYNGTAGYLFDSIVVASNHFAPGITDGCIRCHFGKGQGYDFGEHTFRLQYHDQLHDTTPYPANCTGGACHASAAVTDFYQLSSNQKTAESRDSIRIYSDSLRRLLAASFIFDPADTSGTMYKVGDVLPNTAAKILYNYLLYRHDGSRGLHNVMLIDSLLRQSIRRWKTIDPRADFTISDSDVCVGDLVTFTNKSRFTYHRSNWTFGDGNSTLTSPTHAYSTPGQYGVTLAVTNDSTNVTSNASKPNAITVHGPLTAQFAVVDSVVCRGSEVKLVDISPGISTSRSWYLPDVDSSFNVDTMRMVFDQPGTYTIPVRLRVDNACTPGGDSVQRDIFVVVDSVVPVADFSYSPSHIVVNQPVQFTDSSSNSPDEWRWIIDRTGSSAKDTLYGQTVSYTFPATGTPTVVMQATNGCGSHSKTVSLTVFPSNVSPAEVTPRLDSRK